jgi:pyruvate/2-oxoglutarate dehydrogenase complex dihydrolipoamide acyltransferase (E2) component
MIYKLAVPGPIEDVEELRVLEWHRAPGEAFDAGVLLVELETHKAVVEVRPARAGVLRAIHCPAGEWQQVGRTLGVASDGADEPLPSDDDALVALDVAFEVT